eukprot:IDg23744t1
MKKTSDGTRSSTRNPRSRGSNQSIPKAPLAEQFVQIADTAAASVERHDQEDQKELASKPSPPSEKYTRGTSNLQGGLESEHKNLPLVHQPNVAQVRDICESESKNKLDCIKEELTAQDKEIALLRADMQAMNQSVQQSMSQMVHQPFISLRNSDCSPASNNAEFGDNAGGKVEDVPIPSARSKYSTSQRLAKFKKKLDESRRHSSKRDRRIKKENRRRRQNRD